MLLSLALLLLAALPPLPQQHRPLTPLPGPFLLLRLAHLLQRQQPLLPLLQSCPPLQQRQLRVAAHRVVTSTQERISMAHCLEAGSVAPIILVELTM